MENIMTEKRRTLCKFFNSGYCKFRSECKFIHAKEICSKTKCKNKKRCFKRHPKNCRYGVKFKRMAECLFKHVPKNSAQNPSPPTSLDIERTEVKLLQLKAEVKYLREEKKEKQEDIKILTIEIEEIKIQDFEKEKTIF